VFSTASESLKRSSEILKSQLEAVGFEITINNLDFAAWLEKFNAGNFELIGNPTSYKADPFWYLKVRTNRHGPVFPETTQMEEQILSAPDQETYISLLQDYQRLQASLAWPNLSLAAEGMWVAYGPSWSAIDPPVSMDRSFLAKVAPSE
jgi:ABC-type transport system substrate-binding protein